MLEFAGTAVVMGNAADAVKAVKNVKNVKNGKPGRPFHVTGSNDEGGLADAIRRFVLDV
jgi:hydroxymethylpyrimidine pyrophosphatase-like HAD family hydrolase